MVSVSRRALPAVDGRGPALRAGTEPGLASVEVLMRRTSALLLLVGLLGVATACGDDGAPVDTGSDPDRSTEAAIRISVGGGFVPRGADFGAVPNLVLDDGTVYTGGAMTMQYPGPPLFPVSTGTVSPSVVDDLLDAARAAGLDRDGVDYGRPGITDVGTTTITVVLDGTEHVTAVYALGMDGPAGPDGAEEMDGLTAEQRAERERVAAFVAEVQDRVGAAATETFEPSAYQVLSFPTDPASASTEDPRPNEIEWPAAIPTDVLGRTECVDLVGDQAAALTTALADATSITVWRDDSGATWHLAVRATLPGDEPCPA